MKLVLKDKEAKVFKQNMATISSLMDEGNLRVTEEGLKMNTMDPAHVCMVDLEVPKEAFDEYELEEEYEFGVDLERLSLILTRHKAKDGIILEFNDKKNQLDFTFGKRSFSLPLIEVNKDLEKVPNLPFTAEITIDSNELTENVKDCEIIAEFINIGATKDALTMHVEGDMGSWKADMDKGHTYGFKCEEEVESKFSVEYLKTIIKAGEESNRVTLHIGKNIPIKIAYESEYSKIWFLLAPRIESE